MEDAKKQMYHTDSYPREGCRVEVLVEEGRFKMRVYAPGDKHHWIESYAPVDTPEDIGRMLTQWCSGKSPVLKLSTMRRAQVNELRAKARLLEIKADMTDCPRLKEHLLAHSSLVALDAERIEDLAGT